MFSSLRVAIADDDCRMCEFLQQMVRRLGNEVVAVAENGDSLIKQCAIAQPDVVLTGDLMPDMCGADIAALIYRSRPIPIILFSDYCDRERLLDAEQKHVFMYLVKPIIEDHLAAALESCRRQGSGEPSGSNEDSVFVVAYPESFGSRPIDRCLGSLAQVKALFQAATTEAETNHHYLQGEFLHDNSFLAIRRLSFFLEIGSLAAFSQEAQQGRRAVREESRANKPLKNEA